MCSKADQEQQMSPSMSGKGVELRSAYLFLFHWEHADVFANAGRRAENTTAMI
jgi:hypothetical protein